MKIFGPLRTSEYDEKKHGKSPSCTIQRDERVVSLAMPGMVYKLRYQCGGGGGHEIMVKDWRCEIFPHGCTVSRITTTVNGRVHLKHKTRLGPDVTTGLWEKS